MSPCRSDCIFTLIVDYSIRVLSVQSLRIPRGFLLIVRTGWIFTARYSPNEYHRILGVSSIQLSFVTALKVDRYSYGRRLPGLRFRASPPKGLTLPRNLPAPGRRQCVYIVLRLRTHLCF